MQIAMVGLGKMGANMTTRLLNGGHHVVVYDRSDTAVAACVAGGAVGSTSLKDLVGKLTESPKVVWVMVPSGKPTDDTIDTLAALLAPGDIIIDGGNTNYKDGLAAYERCKSKSVALVDAGTSGGVWGLKEGYCLMVGGDDVAVRACEPIFLTLAPKDGYAHVGPAGAGHFSKMVHNGIEYGLLQAYGEGFEILEKSPYDFDLKQLAEVWRNGSVVRSWLLDLAALAFTEDAKLESIRGYVDDTGEGRWTIQAALDENVPAPVITLSLLARFASRQDESFSAKFVAALRNQFGGHAVKSEPKA
ncbi:MAG: phosphogluconate dehydrogenase (NAD(+)-dependent, decarboxylating) [Vulcanimicrobiaceae bacterium]